MNQRPGARLSRWTWQRHPSTPGLPQRPTPAVGRAPGRGAAAEATGFSLTEVLITVTIIGILSAFAVPQYINSLNKGRQTDAATQVSQIQAGIQSYADEFLIGPSGWSELSRVTPVITPGSVASGSSFTEITSASGDYTITVTATSSTYLIQASSSKAGANWNIAACVNTASGASLLNRGNGSAPAASPACT